LASDHPLHMLVHQGRVHSVLPRAVLLSRWWRVRCPLRAARPSRGVPPAHPGHAVEKAFSGVGGDAALDGTVPYTRYATIVCTQKWKSKVALGTKTTFQSLN